MTAGAWLDGLLTAMGSVRKGKKHQCPAHGLVGEHSRSLDVAEGSTGAAVLWCYYGCGLDEILNALRLPRVAVRVPMPTPPVQWHHEVLGGVRFPPPKACAGGSKADRGFRFESEHPYGDPVVWAWKERWRHPSGAKEIA